MHIHFCIRINGTYSDTTLSGQHYLIFAFSDIDKSAHTGADTDAFLTLGKYFYLTILVKYQFSALIINRISYTKVIIG